MSNNGEGSANSDDDGEVGGGRLSFEMRGIYFA